MKRGAGRWGAVLLIAVAGGVVAWFAWSGGGSVALRPSSGESSASEVPSESAVERSGASDRGVAGASGGAAGGELAPSRTVEAVDPLAIPEPDAIDAVESEGRALFWGVVLAPDGTPCAGVSIWHDARLVATSDELGRYRIEVEQRTWDFRREGNDFFDHWLHARKEGVGVVQGSCPLTSQRVDLAMQRGYAISGRVTRRGGGATAGARVEFRVTMQSRTDAVRALFPLATTTDAEGRFAFDALLGERFALRATADGWASCGWFEFDADPVRGRHGIELELDLELEARGWFVPWPPPGVERSEVAAARIVATDGQVASPTAPPEPASAPIAEDGTFAVPFVATPALELRLDVAGGVVWQREVDLPREPRDLDLGAIELVAPGRIGGELALPPELLELGFEVVFGIDGAGGLRELRVPVAADGRFLSPPLPSAPLTWCVALGKSLAQEWRVAATGEKVRAFGAWIAGATRDLGRLVPAGALFAGRVVGSSSVAGTIVACSVGEGDEAHEVGRLADEQGRYLVALPGELSDWLTFEELTKTLGARLTARRHGRRASLPLPWPPTAGDARRVDVELGEGARVSGRVVDDTGAPRRRIRVMLLPIEPTGAPYEQHFLWTDGDGRFARSGLAPCRHFALDWGLDNSHVVELGELTAPTVSDITLKWQPDDPAERK